MTLNSLSSLMRLSATSCAFISAGLLLTACQSSAGASETSVTKQASSPSLHNAVADETVVKTVKPGAAVRFEHELESPLKVGEYSDISITLYDEYTSGSLNLEAKGSEFLDILPATAFHRTDMSNDKSDVWRVSVRPLREDVHYLNIQAVTAGISAEQGREDALSSMLRAHSIRLAVGEDMAKKTKVNVETSPTIENRDTDNLAVFEANETVRANDD